MRFLWLYNIFNFSMYLIPFFLLRNHGIYIILRLTVFFPLSPSLPSLFLFVAGRQMVQRKACVITTTAKPNELLLICSLIWYPFFGNKTHFHRKANDQYFIHCISSENLEQGVTCYFHKSSTLDLQELFVTF